MQNDKILVKPEKGLDSREVLCYNNKRLLN